MRSKRLLLFSSLGFIAMLLLLVIWQWPRSRFPEAYVPPVYSDLPLSAKQSRLPFLVLGDTQQTHWFERWILQRESNPQETRRLLKYVSEEKAGLLAILGDLTFEAASAREWMDFDEWMKPVLKSGLPVLPLLGNHDYGFLGGAEASLSIFRLRFPGFAVDPKATWYARQYYNLGLIWLDSNKNQMSENQWAEQLSWFGNQMSVFERVSEIAGIVVFTHHPPFTNNTRTGDEIDVQNAFVPRFLGSSKAVLFVSGHAHGYERFEKENKIFLVSGGGGGPRVQYRPQNQKAHFDLYDYAGTEPRPFHFLRIQPDEIQLKVEALGFEKSQAQLEMIDQFFVPFVRSPSVFPKSNFPVK